MNSRQCSTLRVIYSSTYILSVKAIRKPGTRRFLQWGADQNRQDPWCRISTLVCAPFSQESMYNCIWWHGLPVLSKPPNLPNPILNYLVSTHWDREYLLMATPLWQIRIAYSRRRWSGSAKGKDKPTEIGCRQFRPYWMRCILHTRSIFLLSRFQTCSCLEIEIAAFQLPTRFERRLSSLSTGHTRNRRSGILTLQRRTTR